MAASSVRGVSGEEDTLKEVHPERMAETFDEKELRTNITSFQGVVSASLCLSPKCQAILP